jgi:O-antigen/teichoic acid export membrane protein
VSAVLAERGPSLRRNVVANYAGKLWSIASVYAFVPLYIQVLGIGVYGLIAFYSVALAILYIADAGMSAAFAREASREPDRARLRDLRASAEWALLAIVSTAGVAMMLCAGDIAQHWMNSGTALSQETATQCVRLMPLALVPQIVLALYNGGLMGRQRQVRANALTTLFSVVRSGLVVIPIWLVPDPRVFFAWQAAASWAFLLVTRAALRRELGASALGAGRFSWRVLKPILGYAGGMLAMSIIAGLNTQLDRIVVSTLRPLEEFAWYSLAATLAQIPAIVTLPIAAALLPRLTELVESRRHEELRRLYELNSFMIAAAGSAAALALAFFADDVARTWMGDRALPAVLVPVIRILAIGGLFLALQLTPFQLSLAHGHNRTNVQLGIGILLVTAPLQFVLTTHFGLLGAGVPWLLLNAFAFVYLGVALNLRFNEGHAMAWFFRHSLPPVAVAAVVLGIARTVTLALQFHPLAASVVAAVSAGLSVAVSFALRRAALFPRPHA